MLFRSTLDNLAADLLAKARSAADRLSDPATSPNGLVLERLRDQLGVQEAALVAGNGQVLIATGLAPNLAPERPPAALIRQAHQSRGASQLEGLEEDEPGADGTGVPPRVRAIVQVPSASLSLAGDEERYLMLVQALPRTLARNALTVQAAYREYQARSQIGRAHV